MLRIVFVGPPGVGKGTQSKMLAERLRVPAVSTGDLFRSHVLAGSALGNDVARIVASGGFVPDATTDAIVAERLAQADAAEGFILDGYPRTIGQAISLDALLAEAALSLDAVVSLEAPDDTVIARILDRAGTDGRADDTPVVIGSRLSIYRSETEPLLYRYRDLGILASVSGDGSVDDVAAAISRAIESTSTKTAARRFSD